MKVISVFDILKGNISIDSQISIKGWIRTRRDSKVGISFLSVYDGSCFQTVQVIIDNSLFNYNRDILRLTTGCSIAVTGKVVNSIGWKQKFEIYATEIKVIGWIEDPNTYPISAKHHSVEHLRKVSHLRPRTNLIGSITRIRHTLAQSLHRFFDTNGYLWISTPLITALNAEGAGKMFRVSTLDLENLSYIKNKVDYSEDFFRRESFLAVSGQLHSEAYACALSKVYTFGPTFRAENSNTGRHLAEFWMVEPELAFSDLNDVIELAESMLKYVFQAVLNEREEDMKFFVERMNKKDTIIRLERFISSDFVQINYEEVISVLEKCKEKFKYPIYWGMDLASEHERYLVDRYFKVPIVIKNYPKEIKAFYMRLNDDHKTVAAMDILVPGIGEIIGGSQREERLDMLDMRMKEMELNKEDYWWYRDLRRYGTVPHSGFGLGFERLISYVTNINNVQDVIPFPRTPHNLKF